MKPRYVPAILCLLFWSRAELATSQIPTNLVITGPATTTPGNTNTILKVNYLPSDQDGKTLTGSDNIFLGYSAGNAYYLSTFRSTVLGAGAAAYTGRRSTAITTDNTLVGANAGAYLIGNFNTFTGSGAGGSGPANQGSPLITGNYNTFTGYQAGYNTNAGNTNTYLGSYSGFAATQGSDNIAVGISSLARNQQGGKNVAVGDSAGYNNLASNNLFIGSKAGFTSQNGQKSTFVGYQSGYNAEADSNTFVGYRAGYTTTSGRGNTFVGTLSGRNNSSGSHNTFIGNGAGPLINNADDNVYVGYNTGQTDGGSRNTLLGTGADVLANTLQNATAIGSGAKVGSSNALVLGNGVNVGIGTSTPTARLEIVGSAANTSGLRLSQLTARSPVTQLTDQFLTVNEQGDLIKARYQLRIASTSEWSDKVFAASYQLRPLASVARYVQAHGHLPGIPSATDVVNEGVDLTKMNALLLEKVEELTLYLIQQQKRIDQLEEKVRQVAKPN